MIRRFVILSVTVLIIAAIGMVLNDPPEFLDSISEASPKTKKSSNILEGKYVLCINKAVAEEIRNAVKNAALGREKSSIENTVLSISLKEGDNALLEYAGRLSEWLEESGIRTEIKTYSATVFRSRLMGDRYRIYLATDGFIDEDLLENADYITMDSEEMRAENA